MISSRLKASQRETRTMAQLKKDTLAVAVGRHGWKARCILPGDHRSAPPSGVAGRQSARLQSGMLRRTVLAMAALSTIFAASGSAQTAREDRFRWRDDGSRVQLEVAEP